MENSFKVVSHTADLQIHVEGNTLSELFKNSLIGMFQSIKPEVSTCKYKNNFLVCSQLPQKRLVSVDSSDKDSLLVDFLSEALYLSDLHNEAYLDVLITDFNEKHIEGELHGIRVEGFENEIKAVTYHDLHIINKDGVWQVDIVFDI